MTSPHTNWVKIEFDYEQFQAQVKTLRSGLKIDSRHEKYEYQTVYGKVAEVCTELFYTDVKGDYHEAPLEYETEIELLAGDEVYFNYLSTEKAVLTGRHIVEDDKNFIFLRYDRLYAILRGGEWFGINGWKIVQPVADKEQSGLFKVKTEPQMMGVVVGVGLPVKDYWDKKYQETDWVKKGDEICYLHGIPLENDILKTKEIDLLRVRESEILYKGDYEMNPTVLHIEKRGNVKSVMLGTEEKVIGKGEILHGGKGEVLYHTEFERVVSRETFITRVAQIADIGNQQVIIPI